MSLRSMLLATREGLEPFQSLLTPKVWQQQGFILATLISTVAGTFITGINLYDRLVEQRRQKKLDRGQNKKIKELEQRLNEAEEEKKKIRENRQETQGNDKNNNLRGVFEQSGSAVQREYDRYYENMGPRFAQGDCKLRPSHPFGT